MSTILPGREIKERALQEENFNEGPSMSWPTWRPAAMPPDCNQMAIRWLQAPGDTAPEKTLTSVTHKQQHSAFAIVKGFTKKEQWPSDFKRQRNVFLFL